MRHRIMIVGRDVELRARLARLLKVGDYRVEIAESASHACRIGFAGIALAIVAPDDRNPEERGPLQELQAEIGNVLLVAAPGSKRDPHSDLLDVTDETGLLARVAEALAPAPDSDIAEPTLQFAGYRLDLSGHSLLDPTGKEVPLTHGEFSLLRVLVQKAGRVLSREQLLQTLAGREAEAYDRSIDMQIVRLRRKIEPGPKRPTLIVTVPNAGYKFGAKVHQAETPAPGPETAPAPPAPPPAPPERRYVTALAAELLPAQGSTLPRDPEELRAVIEVYRRYAAAVVARYGGMMAESRGREVLAWFGYPVAQEHAAEQAIHAALSLVDRRGEDEASLPVGLAVRLGVASGLVVADPAGEVLGETPSEAIQLLTLAMLGAVVVDEATRRLTGALFEWADLGEVPLNGALHPGRAWRVLGHSAVESRFEALRAPLSPMVGREEELELLLRRWAQARNGQGRTALVTGEAGIGKSRLVAELMRRLEAQQFISLRYFCSPHHQDTPLYPVIRQLQFAAGFAGDDSPTDRLGKLRALLELAGSSAEDVALIAGLLQLPLDGLPVLNLSPQRRKERTFEALFRQLERLSQQRPVLMAFEDLHWADPTTLELIDSLVQRLPELPILVVLTFRTEFQAPWIGQAGVMPITLSRLDRRDATTLAQQLTTSSTLSPALIERVAAQSDGVPLFIEELTKAIVESIGQMESEPSTMALPATLQASLLARLDRSPAAKQVAQVGAVFGRHFSRAVISKVTDLPETVLNEGLDQLVAAGLIFCRGQGINANYTFKHALIQDAAYDSLLKARRAALHRLIAEVLEQDAETATMRPELLGHHFAQAGVIEKAVACFLSAGEQSAANSAMTEAHAHLTHGLELAAAIADPSERSLRRAQLGLALGNVQMAVHGMGSPQHRDAFAQALAFQRELRPEQPDFMRLSAGILGGDWDYKIHSGKVALGRDVAARLLDLSLQQSDTSIRVYAALSYGLSCLLLGHVSDAIEVFDDAKAHCQNEDYETVASYFGVDARSLFQAQWSRALACAGYPSQAEEQARLGVENARCRDNFPSVAITLSSTCFTAMVLGNRCLLQQRASELCQLSRSQGFGFWLARSQMYTGWVAGTAGEFDRGMALLNEAITHLDEAGILLYQPEAWGSLA
ncbi:MAG TPA: AAA family ATPase, partial [Methylocella sp.]|nr:AAA family ATPase [Methylocella sp.]